MRHLTLQLVKRELPAPEHDVERVRQIMFANLRRRLVLNSELPFGDDSVELDREWVAQWLADSNMADQAQSITATCIADCVCNTCRGNTNPGLLADVDNGAAYHFHWKRNGVARSVGIVSLMPLDVLRDWALPNEMKSEPELVRALEMLVDDRLIWCVQEGADDEWLRTEIEKDVKRQLPPRLVAGAELGDVTVEVEHIGNRSIIGVVAEVRWGQLKTLVCRAKGGRTLLTQDLR